MKRNTFFPRGIRRPIYAPTVGEWLCMCLGILAACAALWFFAGCTAPTAPTAPLVLDLQTARVVPAAEATGTYVDRSGAEWYKGLPPVRYRTNLPPCPECVEYPELVCEMYMVEYGWTDQQYGTCVCFYSGGGEECN